MPGGGGGPQETCDRKRLLRWVPGRGRCRSTPSPSAPVAFYPDGECWVVSCFWTLLRLRAAAPLRSPRAGKGRHSQPYSPIATQDRLSLQRAWEGPKAPSRPSSASFPGEFLTEARPPVGRCPCEGPGLVPRGLRRGVRIPPPGSGSIPTPHPTPRGVFFCCRSGLLAGPRSEGRCCRRGTRPAWHLPAATSKRLCAVQPGEGQGRERRFAKRVARARPAAC
uniref:Uncharacterized protein n=1 Tax=Sphaerodactylus townsendi TaxID=933632 RepID=A0ACB8E6L6_9SAUR